MGVDSLSGRTTYQALNWILDSKKSSGCLVRCRLRVMEFEFEIQHSSGRKHMVVDALPRLPATPTDDSDLDNEIPTYKANEAHAINDTESDIKVEPLTTKSFVSAQEDDAYCRKLAEETETSDSQYSYDERSIVSRRARLDRAAQNLDPTSLQERVLAYKQAFTVSGHPGARQMYDTMRRSY